MGLLAYAYGFGTKGHGVLSFDRGFIVLLPKHA